ncbi:hypothetical protein FHS95_002638 [Sphingomonas naasensis]|uniref:Uncharacterized protein n=2 Tax=Sphingomonas naasensis TaxID=1344951 RepID=A0A4V3QWP3_9SPHN|nr:hypothetical protein [Sphingomonas naasensis]NIJ20946.1 hypothetical protein [Sphingomonas naasensis]TGX43332.1 hypothetical protein E5A74_09220 [Sphingomonas naasensis]
MDLYNNEVGRRIAVEQPNASPEALAGLVQKALDKGGRIVVDRSDDVARGRHGMADPTPASRVIATSKGRCERQRFVRRGAVPLEIALALALAGCGGGFDKAGWAAERGNYDGESRRGAMVTTLDEAGIVPGASRESVRAQLGEPDSSGPAADIYYLGRSATGPSFETYRIEYDAAGKVRAARVQRG